MTEEERERVEQLLRAYRVRTEQEMIWVCNLATRLNKELAEAREVSHPRTRQRCPKCKRFYCQCLCRFTAITTVGGSNDP